MHPTNVGLMLDFRQGGVGGGGRGGRFGHSHSAPPLVGKEKESFFLYFAVISVKIGHFKQ